MYQDTIKSKQLATKSKLSREEVDTKVNRICDGFLRVLKQPKYKDSHLQNVITSHVSKVPPDLEAALDLLAELQGRELIHPLA